MSAHWTLDDRSAFGTLNSSQVRVPPVEPGAWAVAQTESGTDWKILQIQPVPEHSLAPEEAYVRQTDLITRFAQSESDQFAFQVNYRLLDDDSDVDFGLEVWLSVQTGLLDSSPELDVACQAIEGGTWQVYEHGDLVADGTTPATASQADGALADADQAAMCPAALLCQSDTASALWLIEPSDQRHTRVADESDTDETARLRVFGHFMEKGVIRRARMRFYLTAKTMDLPTISQLYRDFASSPLPLTA